MHLLNEKKVKPFRKALFEKHFVTILGTRKYQHG